MPSLRKLAQLAGVHPSTVTRALRGDPRISAEMRTRIQALADQYHYLPNRLTQSLVTGRSYTIGVLLPSVVTPYSSRMLAGMLANATAAGYRVMVKESLNDPEESWAAIQMFIEQRVDGILLDTGHLEPIPRNAVLAARSQQVILIGLDATTFESDVDRVHTDEMALATQAIDYLIHLGHSRIAFVERTMQGQLAGRGQYIAMAFQQRLLSTRDFIDVKDTPPYMHARVGEILDELLARTSPPTAIIAWEDPLAALLIKEAAARDLRIPQDLSILGFGNLPFATLMTPTLTTFEQHPERVGQQAFALFLARVAAAGSSDDAPTQSVAIRPTLMLRESCASARGTR